MRLPSPLLGRHGGHDSAVFQGCGNGWGVEKAGRGSVVSGSMNKKRSGGYRVGVGANRFSGEATSRARLDTGRGWRMLASSFAI